MVVEPPYFSIWMLGLGQMEVVGRGANPPIKTSFAECGKWLRIGCRSWRNLRNFDFSETNDFKHLQNHVHLTSRGAQVQLLSRPPQKE